MDAGFRTPLLDFFRRGEVARDIRLLAARGALAPRAHEQLALLMLLVGDHDPEVAAAAERTIEAIPRGALAAYLARTDAPSEVRSFFAARGIEPDAAVALDPEAPIVEPAPTGPEPEPAATDAAHDVPPDGDEASTLQRIAALNVAQRVVLAMKGTREERAVLVRDPNKMVAVAVLSSPKLSESEIESIARMANVSDEILRIIAGTRAWVKNYGITLALARNPKTPVALSMNMLSRLNDKDLRVLSTDRNVPDVLRLTARKKVVIDR
jgi:hypothetical protein